MSVRDPHVPINRLTALAFTSHDPAVEDDRLALGHMAECVQCAATFARLSADADRLHDAACREADLMFPDPMLEAQRARILDRLAHLGHVARVLRFPTRRRDVAMPVSTEGRRWISVAAAAGLIIGLVAGQMIHFVPWDAATHRGTAGPFQVPVRQSAPLLIPASTSGPALSDDELLDAIEAAVQLGHAQSLRALDALTPTAADLRELSLGQ